MKVLLLSADIYSITDETTGEINKGSSLWYANDYREDSKQSMGFKPTKVSGSVELFEELQRSAVQLPAYAEFSYITRPGAGGKASLLLSGVNLIEHAEIF